MLQSSLIVDCSSGARVMSIEARAICESSPARSGTRVTALRLLEMLSIFFSLHSSASQKILNSTSNQSPKGSFFRRFLKTYPLHERQRLMVGQVEYPELCHRLTQRKVLQETKVKENLEKWRAKHIETPPPPTNPTPSLSHLPTKLQFCCMIRGGKYFPKRDLKRCAWTSPGQSKEGIQ